MNIQKPHHIVENIYHAPLYMLLIVRFCRYIGSGDALRGDIRVRKELLRVAGKKENFCKSRGGMRPDVRFCLSDQMPVY